MGLGELPWKYPRNKVRLHQGELKPVNTNDTMRKYKLYLPIGRRLKSLKIGYYKNQQLKKSIPNSTLPIITYGTSICHGGDASRPGLTHPMITSRMLNIPWINLGFSGNARMEKPIVELMSEVEAQLYIIDCLPNMQQKHVRKNMPVLIETLKTNRPNTPILFIPDRLYGNATFFKGGQPGNLATETLSRSELQRVKSQWQLDVFETMKRKGIRWNLPRANGKLFWR